MRDFGALLFRLLLERSEPGRRVAEEAVSATRVELEAVAAELRHLSAFLREMGRGWFDHELGPEDAELSKFARRLAGRVRRLAESIEEKLGRGTRPGGARP